MALTIQKLRIIVFSLKGWDNIAQGNALGKATQHKRSSSLKGWDRTVAVLQAAAHTLHQPRALPWAMLSQPFRLENALTFPRRFPPDGAAATRSCSRRGSSTSSACL